MIEFCDLERDARKGPPLQRQAWKEGGRKMSNVFRAKWKKLEKIGRGEKKDKNSKTAVKETSKRKALSVSTPPEPNQINHQVSLA